MKVQKLTENLQKKFKRLSKSRKADDGIKITSNNADDITSKFDNFLIPKVIETDEELAKIQPYLDSLKLAIDADGVNNIAVTGPYGSGKSTVIRSFQKMYPETDYKYLNISLSSFDGRVKKIDSRGKDSCQKIDMSIDEFERKLEVSILQQMFYQVKASDIPDSRFKRIDVIDCKQSWIISLSVVLWMFSIIVLFKFEYIDKLNPSTWDVSLDFDFIAFCFHVVFVVGIGLIAAQVFRFLKNSKINKLNLKGELELGENLDKSVFNRHLEEILYFFRKLQFDVVILEDIDRFDSIDIFSKLREINILINNSKEVNHKVKFIYAIRDEFFIEKSDRVKFFDFIIPVIPFINSANASDQLQKLIDDSALSKPLSKEFTEDLVTFIHDIDMRLLKNIFQEYLIYSKILSESLDQNKLFCVLVYKNLYPQDYSDLTKRQGKLYSFINKKGDYLSALTSKIDQEIKDLSERITIIESERQTDLKELRIVYLQKLSERISDFYRFYFFTEVSIDDAATDRNFGNILNNNYEYKTNSGNLFEGKVRGVSFSSIESEISKVPYKIREESLRSKLNGKIVLLRKELLELEKKRARLSSSSLKDIFETLDITPYVDNFDNGLLVRFLILNGYIDENIEDYISLFHGITITQKDFEFERNVKGGVVSSPDYVLEKVDSLIKKLPKRHFAGEAIWNYTILDHLLLSNTRYTDKLNALIQNLSGVEERQVKFVLNYIKRGGENLSEFVRMMCESNTNFWEILSESEELAEGELEETVRLIFETATLSSISSLDSLDTLQAYLEGRGNFFMFMGRFKNTFKIKKFIQERNLKIDMLDDPLLARKELFDFVYSNSAYKLNQYNVLMILRGKKFEHTIEEFTSSQYTIVIKSGLKELTSYIEGNLEVFVKNNLIKAEYNTKEIEETILKIANKDSVLLETLEEFIRIQENLLSDLSLVEDHEKRGLFLRQNKLIPSWTNVLTFASNSNEPQLDDILITYLNNEHNYTALAKNSFESAQNDLQPSFNALSELIVYSKDLSINSLGVLAPKLHFDFSTLRHSDIEKSKLMKLVELRLIGVRYFDQISTIDSALSTKLVEVYGREFWETVNVSSLSAEQLLPVFNSLVLSREQKTELFNLMNDDLVLVNRDLAHAIGSELELSNLELMRSEVLRAVLNAVDSLDRKIDIILYHIPVLDDEVFQELVESLGDIYQKLFIKQNKPIFENNERNRALFEALYEREMIKKYEDTTDGSLIKVHANYK